MSSDTPQGTVSNLDNNTYLTKADKTTTNDDKTVSESNTGNNSSQTTESATGLKGANSESTTVSGSEINTKNDTASNTNTQYTKTNNKTDMESWSRNAILNTDTGEVVTTQETDNQNRVRSEMGMFKLSSSYKPNEKITLDYDVFFKKSQQKEDNSILTEVTPNIDQSQSISTFKKQDPISVRQNMALYYAPNAKHVFAFEAQHLYQDEDPFYNANLGHTPFDLADYVDNQLRQDINQQRFLKTNKTDLKADYFYALTNKGNINVTLGNTYSKQNFDSHIFQVLDNNDRNDLDNPDLNNNVTYAFNDIFVGLHYRFIKGKFTFNPGFSVHQYSMDDNQAGTSNKRTFGKILPDLDVKFQIKKSQTLNYNFAMTNKFTDIVQLA